MNTDRAQLLERVASFDIDGGPVALPFAARLARENGWSSGYADRVVAEYKRFAFLAVTSDAPVCPSEDVDAAWHLHLTYTRSYWERFCGGVLGRPLHHDPTRGGPAEHDKHLAMYARTLARYREVFESDPPADVWPPAAERFGADLAHRSVNTARNWVVPKAPVKRASGLLTLFAAAAVFVPGCNGGANPFALKGSAFLAFLIPAMALATCLGRVIHALPRGPARRPDDDPPVGWDRAAYLAGGPARLTTAAIARLVACRAAKVEGDRLTLGDRKLPADATPAEETVFAALPLANTTASLAPVAKTVGYGFVGPARQLEVDGYLFGRAHRSTIGFLARLPLLVVLLGFALPRFVKEFFTDGPTGYLILAAFLGAIGLGVVWAGTRRLTRRGEHALEKLKERHRPLQAGASWVGTGEAGLAVALFGTVALAGSGLGFLQSWYPRQPSVNSSGGCGTAGCATGGCGGDGVGCAGGGDGGGGDGGGCGGGGD